MHTGGVLKKEGKKETAFFLLESIRGFFIAGWAGHYKRSPHHPSFFTLGGFRVAALLRLEHFYPPPLPFPPWNKFVPVSF